MGRRTVGGAADVPEPTICPTGMSVSSSETQNGQLAQYEVTLFGMALDLKIKPTAL